ncbi:MAG: glycosyltransferase family 2 protein [Nanoarchaeota archaeon]|nr:glycosyltransferase family 2 protein [Nanoarchaeota archaeon]
MKKISIIIPCYNEEEGINNLYSQLNPVLSKLKEDYEVELIFVDDGSKDNTLKLLHQYFGNENYCKIIKHEKNMNLGAAMRTGFTHSTGDIIVTMDSDCTYEPKIMLEMLCLLDDKTSIVTASPYHPLGKVENVPNYRLFLSKSISSIYCLITNSNIHTFTALFRIHKKEVVKCIKFKSNNFLATAEMLIYALMKGYTVREYPTTLYARKYGVSKMKLLMVIKSHFKFVLKLIKLKFKRFLRK